MPIDASRLEDGTEELLSVRKGSQPYRVLQFLAGNEDSAFTQTEIAEATGIKRGSVGAVLSRLDSRGFLRHSGRYWAIADEDELIEALTEELSDSTNSHRLAAEKFAKHAGARYGDVVERVLLFGSVVRGDAQGIDSDVDLLVVIEDEVRPTDIEDALRDLAYDVELEEGVPLSLVFVGEVEFKREDDRPFLRSVRNDAERLYPPD